MRTIDTNPNRIERDVFQNLGCESGFAAFTPQILGTFSTNHKRRSRLWLVWILLMIACRAVELPVAPPTLQPAAPTTAQTQRPAQQETNTPSPTPTAALILSETPLPASPAPTAASPAHLPQVIVHPEGGLYVGDQVSFEVLPPRDGLDGNNQVSLSLEGPTQAHFPVPHPLDTQQFTPFGIGGRTQATFTWVWDTQGLSAGSYDLTFALQPGGSTWTQTFVLQPTDQQPTAEQGAAWALARSACCAVYYITQTEAERDMPGLLKDLDAQAADAVGRMGITFTEPITITLLPRLLGQGGFADDTISVSYLDRDYTASEVERVIHHEMIHILDARLGGSYRPSLLVEGLAVYESGGHFKAEPLMARAAALLDQYGSPPVPGLNWYLPLRPLADDFYNSQHELGYLEGASLIEFMVRRWGWDDFSAFYRDIQPPQSGGQADALDAALLKHFDLSFAALEQDFKAALQAEPSSLAWRDDVELTVRFYDTMRRYQQILDPSAYFLNAWLPDQKVMRQRNIVADYLRHPAQTINLALEMLLAGAARDLPAGRYDQMKARLTAVDKVLDAVENGDPAPLQADPLAARYARLVTQIAGLGLDVQRLEIEGQSASAWVREGLNGLREMHFVELENGVWQQP